MKEMVLQECQPMAYGVIFPKNFQQISLKNAILSGFKFIFKVLIHVFLKEHTKCFSNMIRKFLSDVSIQIPPRVQNQFFHPHWISQGLCHWNSQYTWFSKVSWVFRGTMVHGFSKDSFEFRSISFPRTLSYLIKLSSILFSQSVCLTQNAIPNTAKKTKKTAADYLAREVKSKVENRSTKSNSNTKIGILELSNGYTERWF